MSTTILLSNFMFNNDISAHGKLIYAALKKFANKNGECFPARNTLVSICGISLSSVKRALKELCEANVLKKEKRTRANGSQTSNLYILTPFLVSGDYYYPVRGDIFEFKLSERDRVIYMYLCRCSDKEGLCFPSMNQIAEGCNVSVSTVKTAIKRLTDMNLITKLNQYREDGGKKNNLYCVIGQAELYNQMAVPADDVSPDAERNNKDQKNIEKEVKVVNKAYVRGDIFSVNVSNKTRVIYLYICTKYDYKTNLMPSYEDIAAACKTNVQQVKESMKELEKYGFVKIIK